MLAILYVKTLWKLDIQYVAENGSLLDKTIYYTKSGPIIMSLQVKSLA